MSDKVTEPSLYWLFAEAVTGSLLPYDEKTYCILHAKVSQDYWEVARNVNYRVLPPAHWIRTPWGGPSTWCQDTLYFGVHTVPLRDFRVMVALSAKESKFDVLFSSTRTLAITEFTSLLFQAPSPKWKAGHRKAERERSLSAKWRRMTRMAKLFRLHPVSRHQILQKINKRKERKILELNELSSLK